MRKTNAIAYYLVFCSISFLLIAGSVKNTRASTEGGFGLKAGFSSGNFAGKHFTEVATPMSGYNIGVFASYDLTEYFGVTLELMYTRSGAANLNPEYLYASENKVLNNKILNSNALIEQINTPLLFSFIVPGTNSKFQPRIYVGADFAYFVRARSLNTYAENSADAVYYRKEIESLGNRIEKYDIGIVGGTGISIKGSDLTYWFDARYRHGLTDINTTKSNFIDSKLTRNYMSFQFGVAFNF